VDLANDENGEGASVTPPKLRNCVTAQRWTMIDEIAGVSGDQLNDGRYTPNNGHPVALQRAPLWAMSRRAGAPSVTIHFSFPSRPYVIAGGRSLRIFKRRGIEL
jgi:hypothetical protein